MKAVSFFLCLSVFLTSPGLTLLEAAGADSVLEQIRLYRDGGESERRVIVEQLPSGEAIVVDGLPGSTEEASLQAELVEGEGLRLGSLQFERLPAEEIPASEERREAEAEVERIERDIEDLRRNVDALTGDAELYAQLQAAYLEGIGRAPGEADPEAILALHKQEREALNRQRELEREQAGTLETLEEEREEARRQLEALRQREESLNGRLRITFSGEAEGPVVLRLRSRFGGAGWDPLYRIDAEPAAERWVLGYQARLYNRTGESWEALPVVLMTGRRGWRMEAPELPPVYLTKPEPVQPSVRSGEVMDMAASMDARPMMREEAPRVERLTTQFELALPDRLSMEPFEEDRVVGLAREALSAVFWSTATPALEEQASLHGQAAINLDWPLLPGEATLLVDGAISGRTRLGFTSPGDLLELGFGENPAIEVEAAILDVMDRDAGIFGKVRKYQRHYRSTVTNRMPVEHEVRIRSRFPVSRDEEIEIDRIEPTDLEVDQETGRFEWSQVLAPGEAASFATRFEVTAPRDWTLPGNF